MHLRPWGGQWVVTLFWLLSVQLPAATPPELRPWRDYRTIMWIGDSAYKRPEKIPLFFQRLREMGINTAMAHGDSNLQPLLDNHFPYYVENMVNRGLCLKWNSKVRDWEAFVTDWTKSGRPETAFIRDYCLDDPDWTAWARKEVQQLVRKNMAHEPLAYDLRDELSTTLSANPFDYDFNPLAQAKFREWLKLEYSSLAALNAEWETSFGSWDEVKPFSTDQIKNRMASGDAVPRGNPDWQAIQPLQLDPATAWEKATRWNFAPWADFRTYMDLSLARALDELRRTSQELDPRTPIGIEGTQMPHAFGGYDLWRLSQVLDWIEPYDIGNAREILGSFMPAKPFVTTVFETETRPARRRLWHLLLEGDRGCIVWWSEDCIDWGNPDYRLTPKGQALAPVLKEMTSPLAQLFLRAERERDPVFIHYSQPSIQVDWLLESTGDGSTWVRRFSSFEAEHNRQAKVRNSWLKVLQDLGFSPQFVSAQQIEAGALRQRSPAALVLPSSWAVSDLEAAEIEAFLKSQTGNANPNAAQTVLLCDETPGLFDQHGKLRKENPLARIAPGVVFGNGTSVALRSNRSQPPNAADIAAYGFERLKEHATLAWPDWVRAQLAPMRPAISLPVTARARIHRFRSGRAQLVAIERNIDYHLSEDLKQGGGNETLEQPIELEAILPQARHVYDLWAGKYLGNINRIKLTLDPWRPSLFALTDEHVSPESLLEKLLRDTSTDATRTK